MKFGLLIGALFTLIGGTIYLAICDSIPYLQIAQATGSLAIAISAIVGIKLYLTTIKRHSDEDSRKASGKYLDEAINLLERVYEIYTDDGVNLGPPRNDRLLWLVTARMILRYYRIRDNINQDDHKVIINEHEEYWRHKINTVLSSNSVLFDLAYFMPSGDPYDGDVIHRDSIGVIFDFARWYDDTEDPLQGTDVISMFARGAVPIDQIGVEQYIEQFDEYHARIQERREPNP